jgi:hypothetical protein
MSKGHKIICMAVVLTVMTGIGLTGRLRPAVKSAPARPAGPPPVVTDRTVTKPAEGNCTFTRANKLIDFLILSRPGASKGETKCSRRQSSSCWFWRR